MKDYFGFGTMVEYNLTENLRYIYAKTHKMCSASLYIIRKVYIYIMKYAKK